MTSSPLKEITVKTDGEPRVFVDPALHRFYVSRHDALLLMCSTCGGAVSIVLHVQPSHAMLPTVPHCSCKDIVEYATDPHIEAVLSRGAH